MEMQKVMMKGPIKDRKTSDVSFLIRAENMLKVNKLNANAYYCFYLKIYRHAR
jgi:hypothetical protein